MVVPISAEHRIVFVHIPKCAGTSIEAALGMHGDLTDVGVRRYKKTPVDEVRLFGGKMQHYTAAEIRDLRPDAFDAAFTFAVVRNPWDRFVSACRYAAMERRAPSEDQFGDGTITRSDVTRQVVRLLRSLLRREDLPMHFRPQVDFIDDSNGVEIVDFVGRFEALDKAWRRVCEEVGEPLKLEHRMVTPGHGYRDMFNPVTRHVVAWIYRADIRRFGYSF